MRDVFPVAFLPKNHGLAIAIMSYNGQMNFGLLGDYDALPDLDVIAEGIEASLSELVALARKRNGASPNGRSASSNGAPRRTPADTPA
jgi:hypothetical protein